MEESSCLYFVSADFNLVVGGVLRNKQPLEIFNSSYLLVHQYSSRHYGTPRLLKNSAELELSRVACGR